MPPRVPTGDPGDPGLDRFLAGLDPEQVEAVRITRGPLVIHAGAGSGKTRVISHRVAYAVSTGAVDPRRVLVVTFTDKAAGEMVARLEALGLPGVAARTFHAAALAQLRHFWPSRHGGDPAPEVLASKVPIVGRLARALPGGYRFTPAKDLADEIEWAKSRRLTPATYAAAVGAPGPGGDSAQTGDSAQKGASARGGGAGASARTGGRTPPIPAELFARLWADYERAKDRAGRLDFDDMLTRTVELLESDAEAAEAVRRRYAWFSVDEYQDTNPLQQRLLELWLGDRDDLCVVGDEDQTIYTFTGATSDYLTGFAVRFPHAREVTLSRNYRSSPEILALANRLLAAEGRRKRLVATQPAGPPPTIRRCADGSAELALLATTIRRLVADGTPPAGVAVLVRMNAQIPPIEAELTRAGIAFRVRGGQFFERPEVRDALRLLRRMPLEVRGRALLDAYEARLRDDLGLELEGGGAGPGAGGSGLRSRGAGAEGRERAASLALVLDIARAAIASDADLDGPALLAQFTARAAAETSGSADGVNLLTYHRAKGLEWDAVLLPSLEEGSLPIRQAESDEEIAEERRLLYVGLTRARRHLSLSWAERRLGAGERETRRRPSRFLVALEPGQAPRRRATVLPGPSGVPMPRRHADDEPLMAALRAWRTARARADSVPPYVVAHDALLAAIVEGRPATVAALRRVKGMGPARLDRYGEEILAIVSDT
jgi:DNA helicase-2/ATP-dependent DNA helicase PcrA